MSAIRISEIFGPTIAGEGAQIGKPTVFVRTGGCDYRCAWCDTLYAVETQYKADWLPMTANEVFEEVQHLSPEPILVTLSGGNPAIQPLGDLIDIGQCAGYTFTMETQGSVVRPWMSCLDALTISPKPPSSRMTTRFDLLDECVRCNPNPSLKVVVADEEDYQYARVIAGRYPFVPLYLQPCNMTVGEATAFDLTALLATYTWLVDRAAQDQWHTVTILPQLHTIVWGNRRAV